MPICAYLRLWPARKLDQFCSSSSAILPSSHEYWSEIVDSICRSAIEFLELTPTYTYIRIFDGPSSGIKTFRVEKWASLADVVRSFQIFWQHTKVWILFLDKVKVLSSCSYTGNQIRYMQNVAQCKIARVFIIDVDGATVPYYSYSNGLIVKHQLDLLIKHEVHICT